MLHNKNSLLNFTTLEKTLHKVTAIGLDFFNKKINNDGSLGKDITDISAYFKLPMTLISANEKELAKLVLIYINKNFLQANGDFCNSIIQKSIKPEYEKYWSYVNGWIIRAANLLNFPLSTTIHTYFFRYYLGENKVYLNLINKYLLQALEYTNTKLSDTNKDKHETSITTCCASQKEKCANRCNTYD